MRTRRQYQKGHRKPGDRADRDFQDPVDRGVQRSAVVQRRQQQYDDRGDGRDVEARVDGGDEGS